MHGQQNVKKSYHYIFVGTRQCQSGNTQKIFLFLKNLIWHAVFLYCYKHHIDNTATGIKTQIFKSLKKKKIQNGSKYFE